MKPEFENLEKLIETIKILRSPQGCPWDREQTHKSLIKNFIEETYEAVDAINSGDSKNLREELGDVLLQVLLHSQIADENNEYNIDDVAKELNEKLIRRHPHVFGDVEVENSTEVMKNWDEIKKIEKADRTSVMSGITKAQPALMMASQISKKAVKVGFEWPDVNSLYDCINSEFDEFRQAVKSGDVEHTEEEFGDILFAIVNLARWHKINPELALLKANEKFVARFNAMESLAQKELTDYNFKEYDDLWNQAKDLVYKTRGE